LRCAAKSLRVEQLQQRGKTVGVAIGGVADRNRVFEAMGEIPNNAHLSSCKVSDKPAALTEAGGFPGDTEFWPNLYMASKVKRAHVESLPVLTATRQLREG
jgi:hypothetical protein